MPNISVRTCFSETTGLGASIGSDSGLTGLTDVEYSTVMQLEKHLSDAEIKPYLVLNGIPNMRRREVITQTGL